MFYFYSEVEKKPEEKPTAAVEEPKKSMNVFRDGFMCGLLSILENAHPI